MTTPTDPLYNAQWHFDLIGDIETIWDEFDGSGVHVVVYDDGFEYTHEDLAANYDASMHYRYGSTTYDPMPIASGDGHGTACAGIIGAVDGNGLGGVGVAHGVTMTGVNFLEDIQFLSSTIVFDSLRYASNFDVMSNSWGSTPLYNSWQSLLAGTYRSSMDDAFEYAADNGRDGLGTIICQAAGNDDLNANGDGLNTSRFTITVAATDSSGDVQYYSNWGSSILIAAPASAVTTDLTGSDGYSSGNYTTSFGGTSAATPTVSGVVALMLEANPELGWRDVQNILSLSASQTGSSYGGSGTGYEVGSWGSNGATNWNGGGMSIHSSYGYGMLDAFAAVRMAEIWGDLFSTPATSSNEVTVSASYSGGSRTIADNSTTYANINVSGDIDIEHVAVRFDVTHSWSSDLRIYLVAPDGTTVQLMFEEGGSTLMDEGFEWVFGVDTLRGMSSQGTWRIRFDDTVSGDSGTLSSASLTFYGAGATIDDVYHYTADFSIMAAEESGRRTLSDSNGGTDAVNASAIASNTILNLGAGQTSIIDGVSVTTSGETIENAITGDGNDTIYGNSLNNKLWGMRGDDTLFGGLGNDFLHGGSGDDTALFTNASGNWNIVRFGDIVQMFSTSSFEHDWHEDIETFDFTNVDLALTSLADNNPYSYLATYTDILNAFGPNADVAIQHYFYNGYYEGRTLDGFDEWSYLAGNLDLLNAFGSDGDSATLHYVYNGYWEGRAADSFDEWSYLASNTDLIGSIGPNGALATQHFVTTGYGQGREVNSFDEYRYIASYGDLIQALGPNGLAGEMHYVYNGYYEGRVADFDAAQYLANYADLQAAYGSDLEAATLHYIYNGYYEGRTDEA